jgi:tRNA 2-selenouridine synthase
MASAKSSADPQASFDAILAQALDGEYELVIDARSQREYAEDHLPNAVNLPVVDDDEYAEVGTMHRESTHRAYLIGVAYALKNISRAIEDLVSRHPKDARMLVYCFRGGKRSKLWFDALATIGYRVERLPGGWKAYRTWVRDALAKIPGRYTYHVLCGPTGCGKTRLLDALAMAGAQVLDLEALANHRGSLIGAIPGIAQPTQKWFDSLLLQKLRRFNPALPVWVESESKKIGAIQLPLALMDAPMAERVQLWRQDYSHFERDPQALLERLQHLRPLIGGEEFAHWQSLVQQRRMPELFERLMVAHYDPAYARSIGKNFPQCKRSPTLNLQRLDAPALAEVASRLHHAQPA